MKPGLFGSTHSHGDLHSLDVIEDRCGVRRKHGLPARYNKGRFLGKGGFAKCYEVQDMETKEVYAAKIVAKASIAKPRAHAKLRSEIAIHRSLDHEKVVKFYDYFEDSDYVYIILELCPNQTLNEFMRKRPSKRLSEPEAMFYVYDLIIALKYLHRRRVIHRDLKLGNLFLDADVRLKVGDFGLAAQLEHDGEKKRTICGTPNYIAPEILEGKHGHSFEVDIWSLGVILYTMIIGRPPFETSDVKTTYRRIRYNQYGFPDTVRISDQAKELVTSILKTDPRARPSLDDILNSTWFQSSRLPPPMPLTVSAFTISPRVASGSSSARSETPERGVADFARIDSPVPRFPLRDRSPSSVPTHHATTPSAVHPPHHPPPRGQSAAPLLGTKPPPTTVPYNSSGATTPGRYPSGGFSGGRPPLAYRGNEENFVPANVGCGGENGVGHAGPMSPTVTPARVGGGAAMQCRPQSAHLACNNGSTTRIGPTQASPQATLRSVGPHADRAAAGQLAPQGCALRGGPPAAVGVGRDSSPILGAPNGAANSQPSAATKVVAHCATRSATCSPRQPTTHSHQAAPSSSRLQQSVSTPKESQSRSARGLTSAMDGGNGPYSNNMYTKAAPVVFRNNAPPLSSRNPGAMGESPNQMLTPGLGAEGDAACIGTPMATPLQASSERKQCSARKNERSSSSPALLVDGPQSDMLACMGPGMPVAGTTNTPATGSRQCPSSPPVPQQQMGATPELWVTKWVDYSSKYGVGYILSDGSIGVYFNDSTKIILVQDGNQFDYVTRRTQDKPEMRSTHSFDDYPEDLKKKVTLLRHFKNYMLTDVLDKKDGATVGESTLPPANHKTPVAYEPGQSPYVKKWTRNKHAIMFQLSNKIVQVVFFDKTEAVLSSRSHTVTYVDKRGQVCSYPLVNVLDVPSAELAKRLRYTKDILVNLMGARTTELVGVH